MQTLYDFGLEVQKIREAIDNIEAKGARNASFIVFSYNKCNDIINAINQIIEKQQNPPSGQNSVNGEDTIETNEEPIMEEEGEMNGEPDSGTAP